MNNSTEHQIKNGPELTKVAFISDIHGNIAALREVLKDIDQHQVEEIICLGDIVGYGAEPEACVDLVRERCSECIKGNHDDALITSPRYFNYVAAQAIHKIRKRMYPGLFANKTKRERWDYLATLPHAIERGSDLLVHGSPLDTLMDYILPFDDSYDMEDNIPECFEYFDRFLFVGHTHFPCLITDDLVCYSSNELELPYSLDMNKKAIINVGSVGQPRDGDPRTCYLLYNRGTIEWRRLEYDIGETVAQILALGLDESLAERLQYGR
ncbi:MAG: metallophosphoesterase family protein [Planctomycetota bacterium]